MFIVPGDPFSPRGPNLEKDLDADDAGCANDADLLRVPPRSLRMSEPDPRRT
jgi:hypothetical protein